MCSWVRVNKLTQVEAAALLKVTQPRISDLMRGKITAVDMDALTKMLLVTGARLNVFLPRLECARAARVALCR